MATPVALPKTGNTVEACVISRWVKHPGDAVHAGDLLAEVETDKASFEITSPVPGTLLATFFDEGSLAPVFATICVIGEVGESVEAYRSSAPDTSAEPPATSLQPPAARVSTGVASREAIRMSPRAQRVAAERGVDVQALVGSGPGGRIIERDVDAAVVSSSVVSSSVVSSSRRLVAGSFDVTVDAAGLQRLAGQIESLRPTGGPDIAVADLVAFCVIRTAIDGGVLQRPVHLRLISETPQRLTEAVVRDADTLTLGALAAAVRKGAEGDATVTIEVGSIDNGTLDLSCRFEQSAARDSAAMRRFLSSVKDIIEHAEYHLILRGS